jgi:endoglucanase
MRRRRSLQSLPCAGSVLFLILLSAGANLSGQTATPGYWRTSGTLVLDESGTPLRIAGVNWFGMETSAFAPHGLWVRGYKDMLEHIKSLGFNTVRLPFSNQLFDPESLPTGIDFNRNPDLQDLTGLQVMDRLIAYAGKIGLRIILDRHRPDAGGQSQLWYTAAYPESRWIEDWKMLAARYKGDATVVAVDLHNEPRSPACWACGELSLDWRLAAQRAGNAILAVNPNLLIIVEGVELYANDTYWWGGNLKGVADAPILLDVANRLIYSAHDYPASISAQRWFNAADYPANLPSIWDSFWGYISRKSIAPVLMGEFGSRLDSDSDKKWFDEIIRYLGKGGFHWVFWSWNPNSQDTGGLLLGDWSTVDARKISKLNTILSLTYDDTGSETETPAEPVTPPATPSSPKSDPGIFCTSTYRKFSDWGTGFNADLHVTNLGAGPVDGWTITWQFAGNDKLRDLWNGRFTQSGTTVTVTDAAWNAKLPEQSVAYVGFIVEYSGEGSNLRDVTLNGFPCVSQP